MANHAPDSAAPNGHGLVGHDLRTDSEAASIAGLDRDAKIRSVRDVGCHLANDDQSMRFGKGIGLNDYCWPRLAVVARRRHDNDIAAPHWFFGESNSEPASIQLNASASFRGSRAAT